MQQRYPNAGLEAWTRRLLTGDFLYHLFENDFVPDELSELVDFTEPAGVWYGPITVLAAAFTLVGEVGGLGYAYAPPILFTNTTGLIVQACGYYVTNTADTELLAFARFDAAPVSKSSGESFVVVPTVSDFDIGE